MDAGPRTDAAWEALIAGLAAQDLTPRDLRHIFITHAHVDHYGNARRLAEAAPDATLYAPDIAHARPMLLDLEEEWERQYTFTRRALLASGLPPHLAELSRSRMADMRSYGDAVPVTRWLQSGEYLTLGDGTVWQVVALPGHSMTQVGLHQTEHNLFIAADHLLPHVSSNALLEPPTPGEQRRPRALPRYVEMLRWTAGLPIQQVFPGHGEPFTDQRPLIMRRLQGIEERAALIHTALLERPRSVLALVEHLFPKLRPEEIFLAISEIVGHLDVLEARQQVAFRGETVREYFVLLQEEEGKTIMATIDESFRQDLVQHPKQSYRVIVRTASEAALVAEHCAHQGMTIHHQYRLLPGLALTATGEALLALAAHPAVTHIEPDQMMSV